MLPNFATTKKARDSLSATEQLRRSALDAIHRGTLVTCTADEYRHVVRAAIQNAAAEYIEAGDGARATVALMEVKRLDRKFGTEKKPTALEDKK